MQEHQSGSCGERFLCPSVGVQKGHQEHLINYDRIRDEKSSKQTPRTDPIAAEQGSLSHSESTRKISWNKYFGLRG